MKKKELTSVKLLFITEDFLVFTFKLNKCLLPLRHQDFSSVPESKLLGVWN